MDAMRGFQMHFIVGPAASRGAEGPVIEMDQIEFRTVQDAELQMHIRRRKTYKTVLPLCRNICTMIFLAAG